MNDRHTSPKKLGAGLLFWFGFVVVVILVLTLFLVCVCVCVCVLLLSLFPPEMGILCVVLAFLKFAL